MKSRMFFAAFFKFRNVCVLLGAWAVMYWILRQLPEFLPAFLQQSGNIVGPAAAISVYAVFVGQTLTDKDFHEKFNRNEKIRLIRNLNHSCSRLASEARRYADTKYYSRIKRVIDDKNDIIRSFVKGEHSYLKERIVEQTLNLVVSYLKLMSNFCLRSKQMESSDVSLITNRINMNGRKLNFVKDPNAAEDIKRVIEMDQKILTRLKEERIELERISMKLDYMESTVNMFKHQLISSIESEEMLEKIESAVNEASALDCILEDRHAKRLRM